MSENAKATANQNEAAHAFVDKAADKIHKAISSTGDEVNETKEAIIERLQVNPIASLIVALGTGVVLDRMIRSRRSEPEAVKTHLPEVLLGLTSVGETAVNQILYRRLFADMAKIAVLTVFGALLAGIGAVGGFYALYLMLLGYGISAEAAMLGICGGGLALAVIVMTWVGRSIHRMHQTALWLPLASSVRGLAKKAIKEFKNITA